MALAVEPTEVIDNARVRVTRFRFAPGAATGFHVHEFDYVVTPMTTGELTIVDGEGARAKAALTAGVPYYRERGVAHDVINENPFEFVFVETEIK